MFEIKSFLEKVHIKNFLSLRNVELPLKPLTVLVGPNASGKSNILSALNLFKQMIIIKKPPTVEVIQNRLWAGERNHITFELQAKVEGNPVLYDLRLRAETENRFFSERLSVNNVQIISVQEGKGEVTDESGMNQTMYTSEFDEIVLGFASKYGKNPITGALIDYIKGWKFYNFQPEVMRDYYPSLPFGADPEFSDRKWFHGSPELNDEGLTYSKLLSFWHESTPELFNNVSNSLATATNISIGYHTVDGINRLCLLERYKKPIPIERASDGILRLIAYYILLSQPELPPLITIEEPERSLHPGALTDIANVLEKIAERTQVIITTHSSQLLDTFSSESLSDWLGVLLLHNPTGLGTEIINIEELRHERAALDSWIIDFGVGSAIFYSELLQDLMEKSECQA